MVRTFMSNVVAGRMRQLWSLIHIRAAGGAASPETTQNEPLLVVDGCCPFPWQSVTLALYDVGSGMVRNHIAWTTDGWTTCRLMTVHDATYTLSVRQAQIRQEIARLLQRCSSIDTANKNDPVALRLLVQSMVFRIGNRIASSFCDRGHAYIWHQHMHPVVRLVMEELWIRDTLLVAQEQGGDHEPLTMLWGDVWQQLDELVDASTTTASTSGGGGVLVDTKPWTATQHSTKRLINSAGEVAALFLEYTMVPTFANECLKKRRHEQQDHDGTPRNPYPMTPLTQPAAQWVSPYSSRVVTLVDGVCVGAATTHLVTLVSEIVSLGAWLLYHHQANVVDDKISMSTPPAASQRRDGVVSPWSRPICLDDGGTCLGFVRTSSAVVILAVHGGGGVNERCDALLLPRDRHPALYKLVEYLSCDVGSWSEGVGRQADTPQDANVMWRRLPLDDVISRCLDIVQWLACTFNVTDSVLSCELFSVVCFDVARGQ